jgi:hypothetical protein
MGREPSQSFGGPPRGSSNTHSKAFVFLIIHSATHIYNHLFNMQCNAGPPMGRPPSQSFGGPPRGGGGPPGGAPPPMGRSSLIALMWAITIASAYWYSHCICCQTLTISFIFVPFLLFHFFSLLLLSGGGPLPAAKKASHTSIHHAYLKRHSHTHTHTRTHLLL